jgi:hypothetical protein
LPDFSDSSFFARVDAVPGSLAGGRGRFTFVIAMSTFPVWVNCALYGSRMTEPRQSRPEKRRQGPSLGTALKQAKKAGHKVTSVAIYGDHFELILDEPAVSATTVTPLEAWKAKKNARQA